MRLMVSIERVLEGRQENWQQLQQQPKKALQQARYLQLESIPVRRTKKNIQMALKRHCMDGRERMQCKKFIRWIDSCIHACIYLFCINLAVARIRTHITTRRPFVKTGNSCNNNQQTLYSSQRVYRFSQLLHKELEENLQNHQGGVNLMKFYCYRPSDKEASLLREELFSMKIPSKLTLLPLPLSELQALPALSTHLVYPCVQTTSTASSIYTSSVFMCPNYKHCWLYLYI